MNKKFFALLLAAAISVAGTGCMHNNITPQPEVEETASVQEDSTAPSKENVTTKRHDYTYETVIVTDKAGSTHKVAVTQPKVTQYTTRAPSPSRLTTRPTSAPTTRAPRPSTTERTTTKPSTTAKPTTTAKPVTTSASFKEPKVEYGGTLTMGGNSARIVSHTASLSQNNSIVLLLDIEIVAAESNAKNMYIGYDCYDASGKKINAETVRCVVSVASASTKAIATAPINTAKVVFKSI